MYTICSQDRGEGISPLTFLIVGEDVQTFEGTCGATGTYVMYHVYFPKINLVRLEISRFHPWTLIIQNQTFRLHRVKKASVKVLKEGPIFNLQV